MHSTPALRVDPTCSPSLARAAGPAFELKFLVEPEVAAAVERFARHELAPDPHGDPSLGGEYLTRTLYLDTERRDVLHRARGFRRRKYRLRRYGDEPSIFLERKHRRGDLVRKQRVTVGEEALARLAGPPSGASGASGAFAWFHQEIRARALHPVALLTYRRAAFVGADESGPLRLTLDRSLRGAGARDFVFATAAPEIALLEDVVVCELKFHAALPALFRRLVAELRLEPASVSKYRRLMGRLSGSALAEGHDA